MPCRGLRWSVEELNRLVSESDMNGAQKFLPVGNSAEISIRAGLSSSSSSSSSSSTEPVMLYRLSNRSFCMHSRNCEKEYTPKYHAAKCPGMCSNCYNLKTQQAVIMPASSDPFFSPQNNALASAPRTRQNEDFDDYRRQFYQQGEGLEKELKYSRQLEETINSLQEQLRNSTPNTDAASDLKLNDERALKAVAKTLGYNLACSVKNSFDNQSDCFQMGPERTSDGGQANSILDYSHSEWVSENCPTDLQEFLITLFLSAYEKLYPSRKQPNNDTLTEFISYTTATLFDKLDPSRFQWPPSVGVMVTLSSLVHSTLLQTVLSKCLPGGIGSMVSLSEKLRELASSALPLELPTQNDIIHSDDNTSVDYQPKSYAKLELVNGNVVCIKLAIICQTKVQMDPENAPSNWKDFADCDPNILQPTQHEIQKMNEYRICKIYEYLLELEKSSYIIGSAETLCDEIDAPVIDRIVIAGLDELRRVCLLCKAEHKLDSKSTCQVSYTDEMGTLVRCPGFLQDNATVLKTFHDSREAPTAFAREYEKDKGQKVFTFDDATKAIQSDPLLRNQVEEMLLGATRSSNREPEGIDIPKNSHTVIVKLLSMWMANPAGADVQKDLLAEADKVSNIIGAPGVLNGTRYHKASSTDLGATFKLWWKDDKKNHIHLMPGLHVIINLLKLYLKILKASDTIKHSSLAAQLTYTSKPAQAVFFGGTSKRKAFDASIRVVHQAALHHLIKYELGRNHELTGKCVVATYELAGDLLLGMREGSSSYYEQQVLSTTHVDDTATTMSLSEGGGESHKSFVALVLDLGMPLELLVQSLHMEYDAVANHFDSFMMALKFLNPFTHATGCIGYAPEICFQIVMWRDLYKERAPMLDFIAKHYIAQTEEGIINKAPPKMLDEFAEEFGKKWKDAVAGTSEEMYQQANTLLAPLSLIRDAVMKILKISDDQSRQRKYLNVDKHIRKIENYFDYYKSSQRFQDSDIRSSVLTDFSGIETHTSTNGVHQLLKIGVELSQSWMEHFINTDGDSKATGKSKIVDDAELIN